MIVFFSLSFLALISASTCHVLSGVVCFVCWSYTFSHSDWCHAVKTILLPGSFLSFKNNNRKGGGKHRFLFRCLSFAWLRLRHRQWRTVKEVAWTLEVVAFFFNFNTLFFPLFKRCSSLFRLRIRFLRGRFFFEKNEKKEDAL